MVDGAFVEAVLGPLFLVMIPGAFVSAAAPYSRWRDFPLRSR